MRLFLLYALIFLSCAEEPSPHHRLITSYIESVPHRSALNMPVLLHFGPYELKMLEPIAQQNSSVFGAPYFQISDYSTIQYKSSDDLNSLQEHAPILKMNPLRHLRFSSVKESLTPLDERTRYVFSLLSALDQVAQNFKDALGVFPLQKLPLPILIHSVMTVRESSGGSTLKTSIQPRNNAGFSHQPYSMMLFPSPDLNFSLMDLGVTPSVLAHELGHALYLQALPETLVASIESEWEEYPSSTAAAHYLYNSLHEMVADISAYVAGGGSLQFLPDLSRNPLLMTRRLSDLIEISKITDKDFVCSVYCLGTQLFKVVLSTFLAVNPDFDNQPSERGLFWKLIEKMLEPLTTHLVSVYQTDPKFKQFEASYDDHGFLNGSLLLLGEVLSQIATIWKSQNSDLGLQFCLAAKEQFNRFDLLGDRFSSVCP